MQLTRLRREGLTLPELAERMGISVSAVMEAHRALQLPMPVTDEAPLALRDSKERAAERENWPMRWQQRYEKRKR